MTLKNPSRMQPFWWFKAPLISERIVNGGFETGDFTGWEVGDTSEYTYVDSVEKKSGSYSAKLFFLYDSTLLRQILATVIPKTYIVSFDVWLKFSYKWGRATVHIIYDDDTTTPVDWYPTNTNWNYLDLLSYIPNGKTVKGIRIVPVTYGNYWLWVDDVSLIGSG